MTVEKISLHQIAAFFKVGGKVDNIVGIIGGRFSFCAGVLCDDGFEDICPFNKLCWEKNKVGTGAIKKIGEIQKEMIKIFKKNPGILYCLQGD